MKLPAVLLCSVLLSCSHISSAQELKRGMYCRFTPLLGDTVAEQSLLDYCARNHIQYLLLAGLDGVVFRRDTAGFSRKQGAKLHHFIQKARKAGTIRQIGIAGGSSLNPYRSVTVFNDSFPGSIDVLSIEYEFWNHSNPDESYARYIATLQSAYALTREHHLLMETYLGYLDDDAVPDSLQAAAITASCDRILAAVYTRYVPGGMFRSNYLHRLKLLGCSGSKVDIWPMFSAESGQSGNYFQGKWMLDRKKGPSDVEALYMQELQRLLSEQKLGACTGFTTGGMMWFSYSALQEGSPSFRGRKNFEFYPNRKSGKKK
jgi:hypothetical protein